MTKSERGVPDGGTEVPQAIRICEPSLASLEDEGALSQSAKEGKTQDLWTSGKYKSGQGGGGARLCGTF